MAVRQEMKETHKGIPVMDRHELLHRISLMDGDNVVRDRALIAFLFLTGCRIQEVVYYKINGKIVGHPIKKSQIEVYEKSIIVRQVRTLKRRRLVLRSVPIVINKNEVPFLQVLMEHVNSVGEHEFLWDFSRQRASQICESVGLFNHYMRHIRNTLLITEYDYSAQQLKQFNGWAGSASADAYVHLKVTNLIDKMIDD